MPTPDALDKVLACLKQIARDRGSCGVFFCSGDRDASKRPLMGREVWQHTARIVVTSDNPRREAAVDHGAQIGEELDRPSGALMEADGAQAITYALREGARHDVVLLANKGTKPYQEIHGVRKAVFGP
jgi:UDP-N-acetylmuramoyl-L-alanyl-D-glutamate--2,6-diaminopimelate ligase